MVKVLFDKENHRAVALDGEREIGESAFSASAHLWIIPTRGWIRPAAGRASPGDWWIRR